jgi:hypothetical protein
MIRLPLAAIFIFGALPVSADPAAQPRPDLLRFTNGDRLHGTYKGLSAEGLAIWQHEGADTSTDYQPAKIRQVVLRSGRPERAQDSLSHVALVNGDRIPGRILSFDKDSLTLETSYAGILKIPRPQIGMVAPVPLGGRVLYHGPFNEDEWQMATATNSGDIVGELEAKALRNEAFEDDVDPFAAVGDEPEKEEAAEEAGALAPWNLSGAAWYWRDAPVGTALVRRDGMADRSILRFEFAWQNRLSLAVGFHTDFIHPKPEAAEEPPEADEDEDAMALAIRARKLLNFRAGDVNSFPRIFGSGYVLHLQQNHVILFRTGFDENGEPTLDRLPPTSTNMPGTETGTVTVELRCNRITGAITLLMNDEFIAQWSEGNAVDGYAGKGNGFGFLISADRSPARISDVILAEWNGMPDSARSLQVDDQDIVLLTNGTDRFSGEVTALEDGMVQMTGRYGAFRFPLEEVAEIRFAKNAQSPREAFGNESLSVRLHPIGRISGKPLAGDASSLKLLSPVVGEVALALDSAFMLEFQPTDSFLDDWDPNF